MRTRLARLLNMYTSINIIIIRLSKFLCLMLDDIVSTIIMLQVFTVSSF